MNHKQIMKHKYTLALASLLLAGGIVHTIGQNAPTNSSSPEVLTVAVFDFESKDEAVRDLGPKVATLINADLSAEPQLITVERAELDKALGEQELGLVRHRHARQRGEGRAIDRRKGSRHRPRIQGG